MDLFPFFRRVKTGGANRLATEARIAQLAEHILGKDEVIGSIPIAGSSR